MISAASFRALDAFCSPSAAITYEQKKLRYRQIYIRQFNILIYMLSEDIAMGKQPKIP